MSEEQAAEIKRRLDEDLSLDAFEDHYRSTEEAATQFFQDLFVQVLNFDETPSPLGDATWDELKVHEWRKSAKAETARLFAEHGNFRVVYVELETLTRTAERNSIQSLTRSDRTSGWALDGSFLAVFHAPGEDVWHLVTPYEEDTDDITTGRTVLRRYTLGEGETHRTVAKRLSLMDASEPRRLADRVDEAFDVKPVTEDFYEDYKATFDALSDELRDEDLDIEEADRYAHITLNRLMFFYYLQKKGWIGDRKDFVRWFHDQYEASGDTDVFHEKWLSTLFFEGMNTPAGESVDADLPDDVAEVVSGLAEMNGGLFQPTDLDENDVYLSDAALNGVIRGFLDQYNFTVTEESPYDIDVAVDPAMLGKIYESLIAEEDRGDSGIFYTPRTEVDLMCRLTLYEQLSQESEFDSREGRKRLVEFVFAEAEEWTAKADEKSQLESALHQLDIVDPACGSGAFLVGMMNVLTELHRKIGADLSYEDKQEIINENIYGVDIKEWAVRVAEFRLWLSLVESEEKMPTKRPVLPNFSFNLQTGDSIIQRVGNHRISVQSLGRSPSGEVQKGLQEIKEKKEKHFRGEGGLKEEIQSKQLDLLKNHIDELIRRKDSGEQQTLDGTATESENRKKIQLELEKLETVRDHLKQAESASFFLWELNFSEVMLDGGFDIVIGNPPYIGNEFITDPDLSQERRDAMGAELRSEVQDEYKSHLTEYVRETYKFEPDGQSDYYAYFFYKGLEILRRGGTLSFITSDKWLDRGYGADLQEVFLTQGELRSIIANRSKRSFVEADITTAITTVTTRGNGSQQVSGSPRFVSCSQPYSKIVIAENVDEMLHGELNEQLEYRNQYLKTLKSPYARVISASSASLWQLGGGEVDDENGLEGVIPRGSYSGDKWGSMYIRAPDTIFKVLQTHGGRIRTMGEYNIESYLNTGGAKKFFVVDCVTDVGDDLCRVRNREYEEEFLIEKQFLKPFLGSPRDTSTLRISPEDPGDARILHVPPETDVESYNVNEYIRFGEEKGYNQRSGPSRRTPWWKPPTRAERGASIVLPRTHNDNHRAFYNPKRIITGRFYRVDPDNSEFVATMLNSTFGSLFFEIYGDPRGQGALDLFIDDYSKLPVIADQHDDYEVPDQAISMLDRKPGSVFEELSSEDPEEIELTDIKEDRRVLDEFVMGKVLNLSEEDQLEVYQGLLRLVDERLTKANSV